MGVGVLRIDRAWRVLDSDGRVMPGLYAGGELVGLLSTLIYAGGSRLMAGAAFGKIAGEPAQRDVACAKCVFWQTRLAAGRQDLLG